VKRLVLTAANELGWHLLVMNHVRRVLVDYHRIAKAGTQLAGKASLETLDLMKSYQGWVDFTGHMLVFRADDDLRHIRFCLHRTGETRSRWSARIQAVKPAVVHRVMMQAVR